MLKNSNVLLVILLIATFVFIFGCSGGGDVSSPPTSSLGPDEVVRSYLTAFAAMDTEGISKHFTPEQRNAVLVNSEDTFTQVEEISITNLNLVLVSESGREATVQANYDAMVIITGEQHNSHVRELIDLVKEDDEWLVKQITVIPEGDQSIQGSDEYQIDMEVMQLVVSVYMMDSGQAPTSSGLLPPDGDYAMIDFNASYIGEDGVTYSLYPYYVAVLPKYWDAQAWRIDHLGQPSVTIDPSDY